MNRFLWAVLLFQMVTLNACGDIGGVAGDVSGDVTGGGTIISKTWGTAELIETDDTGGAGLPQIAIDGAGNAMAVWSHPGVLFRNALANTYTSGVGWGTAELIETDDTGGASAPEIAFNEAGNAMVVWGHSVGLSPAHIWARAYTSGVGWDTAELIETEDIENSYRTQIAINEAGNAVAVWYQEEGQQYNIWANTYTSGVGWSTAELIETDDAGSATNPQIVINEAGNAVAVWSQSDGTRFNILANTYTSGAGWGTAELIETDDVGGAVHPEIAFNEAGNAMAVWSQSDGVQYNIWANTYTFGTGWSMAELIESSAGGALDSEIVIDEAGNAVAVWMQHNGTRYNVWSNTYTSDTGWSTAELIETEDAGNAREPHIGIDGAGNAVAVWWQSDGTRTNIWANTYTSGAGWSTAELIETSDIRYARYPEIAVNEDGNAVVVWVQSEDATTDDVWANIYR